MQSICDKDRNVTFHYITHSVVPIVQCNKIVSNTARLPVFICLSKCLGKTSSTGNAKYAYGIYNVDFN